MLAVALVAALASYNHWFSSVDTAYYDLVVQSHLIDYPEDVVVIAVDEASIERLGAWPWNRRYHGQVLAQLEQAEAVVAAITAIAVVAAATAAAVATVVAAAVDTAIATNQGIFTVSRT